MMEEDFYATLKLKSGEEIFAKVCASEEDDRTFLLLSSPVQVSEVTSRRGVQGYKVEPWLKTTTDDMFVINIDDVMTMSESSDIQMIMMYQSFINEGADYHAPGSQPSLKGNKVNRDMGYISTVKDAKEILEKLYKQS